MKKLEKEKIKKFLKEKWYIAGGSALLLIVALVAMFVGFHITGWSIIKWFEAGYGTTFIILIALGGLGLFALYVTYKRHHLGGREDDE